MDQPRLRQRNVGRARRPGRRAGHRPGGAGRPRPAPAHPRSPPAAPSLGFPCARPARGPSLTPPSSRLRPAPPARGPRRHAARHETRAERPGGHRQRGSAPVPRDSADPPGDSARAPPRPWAGYTAGRAGYYRPEPDKLLRALGRTGSYRGEPRPAIFTAERPAGGLSCPARRGPRDQPRTNVCSSARLFTSRSYMCSNSAHATSLPRPGHGQIVRP
jgi:hypothetical protein